jgi:hypothetical protein
MVKFIKVMRNVFTENSLLTNYKKYESSFLNDFNALILYYFNTLMLYSGKVKNL